MPDRRVPRPGGRAETPGGEGTAYPLNDGGAPPHPLDNVEKEPDEAMEQTNKQKKRIEEDGSGLPRRVDAGGNAGGFGVKPLADVLSQGAVSAADKFLILSYQDILSYITGESELEELIHFIRENEEYAYNPPTRDEFGQMLKFAISRQVGKIGSEDAPSVKARASARTSASPSSKKEYADPINKAFPVDSKKRTVTAHAYIHKYWNNASKRGITATYGKEDFVRVHKKIIGAMKKFDIEHNYLDSLDDASGISKPQKNDSTGVQSKELKQECEKCGNKICQCQDLSSLSKITKTREQSTGGIFNFRVGQKVVSFSRGGTKNPGQITKIDGSIANVQWSSGFITTEMLVSLVPDI